MPKPGKVCSWRRRCSRNCLSASRTFSVFSETPRVILSDQVISQPVHIDASYLTPGVLCLTLRDRQKKGRDVQTTGVLLELLDTTKTTTNALQCSRDFQVVTVLARDTKMRRVLPPLPRAVGAEVPACWCPGGLLPPRSEDVHFSALQHKNTPSCNSRRSL